MKTYMAKTNELATRWYVVDVADKILGRVATKIAAILMGKHRPEYTPHIDSGEFVIIINASKVRFSGASKPAQRMYEYYTQYPSGKRATPLGEMMQSNPELVVKDAIRRMLPKTRLGLKMIDKLKVYKDDKHPHQAQQPVKLDL